MRVQFDLRPAGMLEKERKQKSFNLTRLIATILMLFFLTSSIGCIAKMTMDRIWLKGEVEMREDEVSYLESDKNLLQVQVNELKAREKVFSDTLQIMQDDLPTLEVLSALETNMGDYGIGFNTLRFVVGNPNVPNVVEVTGVVASDKQIIDFSDLLRTSGVFREVAPPRTNRNEQTNMISFTLRMPVFPIGQINKP